MQNILREISDHTRMRIERLKDTVPPAEMRYIAESMDAGKGFPFEEALSADGISFICECKRASPSRGIITDEYSVGKIAMEYESAGASCISVLTEPKWFMGENEHLRDVSRAVGIPCLRKDFTVDEYMIYEAKTLGASAVLLISAISDTETLRNQIRICDSLGMSALVEVHNLEETASALDAGARVVGVNNRDLGDFTVNLNNSLKLREHVPEGVLFIAESGIRVPDDIRKLREAGTDGVLIGETLMRAGNKREALAMLRGS
ncbi:MAG: indole-3-glycerol phosphate synthase TrpC [Candidatus Methanoplasma sp.]|jgi:indole-3-glycerol phosphate synthase|nr:indole-3-glycerol phosphate synthase TrpC [Candidatus Methanoplasma sp.]